MVKRSKLEVWVWVWHLGTRSLQGKAYERKVDLQNLFWALVLDLTLSVLAYQQQHACHHHLKAEVSHVCPLVQMLLAYFWLPFPWRFFCYLNKSKAKWGAFPRTTSLPWLPHFLSNSLHKLFLKYSSACLRILFSLYKKHCERIPSRYRTMSLEGVDIPPTHPMLFLSTL